MVLALLLFSCEPLDFKGMVMTYTSVDERYDFTIDYHEKHGMPRLELGKDSYRFYMHSDSHVGDTSNLSWLHSKAREDGALGVFMIGDITTGFEKDYLHLMDFLSQHPDPVCYAVPGNHDLYFDGWNYYKEHLGPAFYTLDVVMPQDSDLYVFLDTGGGTLGAKQLDWFKKILEEKRPKYRSCIVLTHNNILLSRHTISTYPQVEEVHVLLSLFVEHRVDFCISGHDHQFDKISLGRTQFYVTDAITDKNNDASALRLENANGQISIKKITIP